jgi:hypothetical protein
MQQVAAICGHVAQLPGGARHHGLREVRVVLRMNGWLAVSEFGVRAPMDTPALDGTMSASFNRVRSTSVVGRSTSSFIK